MLVNGKENMNNPKVSIVVLNWNGWEDTIECLESLYQITYPNYEVIVVDNDSKDDSIEKIKDYAKGKIKVESKFFKYNTNNKPIKVFEYTEEEAKTVGSRTEKINSLPSNKKIILIKNKKNYGYTGGNNIGIRYCLINSKTDYFLILNNDTVVASDVLSEMINVAESDSTIGIAGPKTFFYDDPQRFQSVGIDINLTWGKHKHIGTHEIDHGQFDQINKERDAVQGSCFLVRKEVIEKIGILDEDYFCYWDEIDYCFRVSKAGYRIVYTTKAKIWHKSFVRIKPWYKALRKRDQGDIALHAVYFSARNNLKFMKKHATQGQYLRFLLYFFCCYFWFKIGVCLIYWREIKQLIAFYRGVRDGLFNSTSGARYYIKE